MTKMPQDEYFFKLYDEIHDKDDDENKGEDEITTTWAAITLGTSRINDSVTCLGWYP
jgi:hypothetical protein